MSSFGFTALIPLLPAAGALINGVMGKRLPKRAVALLACGAVGASFLLAAATLIALLAQDPHHRQITVDFYSFIKTGDLDIGIKFLIDPLSCLMMLVVTGVGFLIHVYSIGYMSADPGFSRFFSYLNLFCFAMLSLVMGGNFLVMFFGWEGVGLCSYLLIGFWYHKNSAANAGKKAFVVNRIGDFGFLLGIFLIFKLFGTLDFLPVFDNAPAVAATAGGAILALTLCLFIGATGKSAQLPLYVWLPDAMEGPTPVSALIHAATMVTAGVYMVARCHVLYLLAPAALTVVATVGALTAIFAASIGLVQNDIKKVLAYSTVSQLGYMLLGCGVGAFASGVFHLMTHAFFKGLLFLGSGSVIHAMEHALHAEGRHDDPQDMRRMGGLRNHMPATFWTFAIGTVAITGFPPFAGFFSKDEILEHAFLGVHGNKLLWAIGAVAAGMTSFYMFRLLFMTFFGKFRSGHNVEHHLHESPRTITIPLITLAGLSAVGGFLGIPLIHGGHVLQRFLHPVFAQAEALAPHEAHPPVSAALALMILSVAIAAAGLVIARLIYIKRPAVAAQLANRFPVAHRVLLNKYYVDEVYNGVVVEGTKKFSNLLWRFDNRAVDGLVNGSAWLTVLLARLSNIFDAGIVDGMVNGVAHMIRACARVFRRLQTGYVQTYGVIILAGICVLICLTLFF